MLEEYLSRLTQELNLEPVTKDDASFFQLILSPDLTLSLKALDPGIYLFSPISPLAEVINEKKEDFFMLLSKANLLGLGTGGAVIAIDKEEKFLTLSLTLPYDINYKSFKETVEDFVNFVDYWRDELAPFTQKSKI